MAKTPDDFYRAYNGKRIDDDGAYGVQCVDAFRVFCKWALNGKVWATGTGHADGYWYYRNRYSAYFIEVKVSQLKDGDWVFWKVGSRSHPSSHVAMYYHGMEFGQNQGGNRGFCLKATTFSDALGGLRWKGWQTAQKPQNPAVTAIPAKADAVFRLYNTKNGDHLFTVSNKEANDLNKGGWKYEGVGWYQDPHGSPVYRLYNSKSGEHFYTASSNEKNNLVKAGWKNEGVAFGSGTGSPVHRLINWKTGFHFFTISDAEKNSCIKGGWKDEGFNFRAKGQTKTTPAKKPASVKAVKATGIAKSFSNKIAKTYKTTANLNVRNDGSTSSKSLGVLLAGTSFQCYGYYTGDFYYGVATANGTTYTGFCHKKYLR